MNGTVLITGGLGYLGGRIARYLSQMDNLHLRLAVSRKRDEMPSWLENGELVYPDLLSDESLDAVCHGVKQIVHLAALNEIESADNPGKALLINGLGSVKLLQAAERAGVERFIYFSTAHVYGVPLTGKISEETLARPVHPYAITHRTAEDFILAAHCQNRITGIALRLSNGFGTPATADVNRWTLLVNDLCRQAVTGGRLVLRSSGLQRRDFITLEDVGRAVHHFMGLAISSCNDGLFNLGGECPMPIIDLAERIAARCAVVLGFTPPILRPEPAPGEVSEFLDYRMDKLRASGFELTGNMDDEIDGTLLLCSQAFGSVL